MKLNRMILIAAAVVIVLVIIGAAIYVAGSLKPRPELVGVLETEVNFGGADGSVGWYDMLCSGYIFNVGSVGCFAQVTLSLSDDRGWNYNITETLRWMPAGSSTDFYDSFRLPTTFNEQEADLDEVQLKVTFRYLDSEEWYEEVDSWLLPH